MSGNFSGGSFSGAVGGFSVDAAVVAGAETGRWDKRRKLVKRISRADYAHQEEYAEAVAAAMALANASLPLSRVTDEGKVMGDDPTDDDDLLLLTITRILH